MTVESLDQSVLRRRTRSMLLPAAFDKCYLTAERGVWAGAQYSALPVKTGDFLPEFPGVIYHTLWIGVPNFENVMK